jgi:uncharacterized protein YjbJ (UPF0337 family)
LGKASGTCREGIGNVLGRNRERVGKESGTCRGKESGTCLEGIGNVSGRNRERTGNREVRVGKESGTCLDGGHCGKA